MYACEYNAIVYIVLKNMYTAAAHLIVVFRGLIAWVIVTLCTYSVTPYH